MIVPSQIYEIFLGDPTYGYHGGFLRSRIPRSQGLFQGIAFRLECPEKHGCSTILADNKGDCDSIISWIFIVVGMVAFVYWMKQLSVYNANGEEDKSITSHSYL